MGFSVIELTSEQSTIPAEWRIVKVRDVAKINELCIQKNYPHEMIEYIDIASVEKGNIKSVDKLLLNEAPSRARRIVRDQDTLISTVRPNLEHYAFIKKAKPNTIASTGFAVVTAKQVDPRFLYYYLTTKPFTNYLTRIANSHTSAYPSFNPDIIENADMVLPGKDEQRAIASILGALDDKIELNRKMNETLEAMARAIFKSWFVDFDPIPGFGPHKEWQDSPLGKIPKGWRVGTLGELCDIVMGQSPPGETYNETGEGLPFYQGIRDFGFRFPNKRVYCNAPTRLADEGDVLLSVRAPVGSLNIASEKCAIGRGVAALRIKGQRYGFLYYLMKETQGGWERYEAEGTVFGSATKIDVQNFSIIVPLIKAISGFNKVVFPMDETIKNNEMQSLTLASIRDALLPKLLSGEIRVKDAERFMEGRI